MWKIYIEDNIIPLILLNIDRFSLLMLRSYRGFIVWTILPFFNDSF